MERRIKDLLIRSQVRSRVVGQVSETLELRNLNVPDEEGNGAFEKDELSLPEPSVRGELDVELVLDLDNPRVDGSRPDEARALGKG
jgi:hypothetical protein